jgi:hypothetical protein
MIEKDGWKIAATVKWIPVEPDEKITCKDCSGSGKKIHFGVSDWDDYNCSTYMGLGFRYTMNKRGDEPDVPMSLILALRNAYLDWEEKQ